MSNPTSNFGWQMPTSTDLVTDLPADFETFGQAVDTSLADLKGGTTGQILSKASGTDMDFTWTTPNPGDITGVTAGTGISGGGTSGDVTVTNAMATTITTKGDLVPGTGSGTFARLAVGNNGETLVADSSTATGLRYNPTMAAGKNAIINGGMDIWQRGTSSTLNSGYGSADRWFQYIGSGSGTYAQETSVVPAGCRYALKFTSSSAGTSQSTTQYIETANTIPYAGKTVTISSQVAASTSTAMAFTFQYSTTVDAGSGASWTTISATTGGSATPTSTTYVSMIGTYAVPSNAVSLRLIIGPGSTIANGVVIYFSAVQLEIGSVATQFSRAGGTIQGELAACQRYYWRNSADGIAYKPYATGVANATTSTRFYVVPPVTMRTVPTSIDYSTISLWDQSGYFTTANAPAIESATCGAASIVFTWTGFTGLTQYRPYWIATNNSTASYLGFSAEL